jgi:protease IV
MAMSRTKKIVLILGGIFLAFILIFGASIAFIYMIFREKEPAIKSNSVLALKLKGSLPDYVAKDPFRTYFLGEEGNSLTGFLTQLKKAKVDKHISAVLLEIDFTDAGWAKADEIRDAISDFRKSNKPIYAYLEMGSNKEYYIATACDRIYVAPAGDLFINGLAAEISFYRGTLDKLGIYPEFYQIGKYKNAPDRYTRKEMSEAHREVMDAILDDIFNRFVDTIAKTRNKSTEDVRALIDNAPLSAKASQDAGLIDGAKYKEEVEKELKSKLGYKESDELSIIKSSKYEKISPESLNLNEGEKIAIIYASGPIGSGKSEESPYGEQTVGSDTVVKALNDARDDKEVKAIVLRVDSPGGSAYASDLIWQAAESAKEKKPVVVSMSDLAASGGYYISAGAFKIIAEPSTLTGSIGVFAGKPVFREFNKWVGINTESIMRGKMAGLFRTSEQFTPEERTKFETMVKSVYYDEFLPKVATGRKRDLEYVDSVAQGRVWTGSQAKDKGLVDEFGGLDRAVEVAKQLANIPADKGVRRVIFPTPRTFIEQMFDKDEDTSSSNVNYQQQAALKALPEEIRRTLQHATFMEKMKRGETMAMMPFELTIK